MNKLVQLFVIFIFSLIVGCGSGGSPTPSNVTPSAVAGQDFSVVETLEVSLNGNNSSDSDGSITSYSWAQTSGNPEVTLNGANSATVSFTAPDIDIDTALTFQLTVTDNDGATDSDSVVVTITPNMAPQAVVPDNFELFELTKGTLDGSSSTDDLAISSYLWEQTAGELVALNNSTGAIADFTAPEMIADESQLVTFSLTVTDSLGLTSTESVDVTIINTPTSATLSGKLTYDHVPHTGSNSLDYSNIIQSDIRGATVELLDANDLTILESSQSDATGNYSFVVTPGESYVIRVKAELIQQDTLPSWDFTVVDNTNVQALYAMDSASQLISNSSTSLNLNASSGWTGSGYTEPRIAASFAILDSVYEAKEKVIAVDPSVEFAALKLNWSINNVAVPGDRTLGQISTSHFNGTEIYILGDEDSDTDEYDGHVIVHEWGHYFEGRLSRSDSLGGSHGQGDKLDMRVALGEGWGNALSGIVTDDPFYRDSFGSAQGQGFSINVESNPSGENKGWFSEASVQSLIYDFYDNNNDGSDTLNLGFTPIYNVMRGGEKETDAFTSIYSFANQLKIESAANSASIDSLLASQDINVTDDFGTGETNDGGDARNLPVYQTLTIGGGSIEVCSYGTNGQYNKLGNRKYLAFEITNAGSYNFSAVGQSTGDDPDFYVYNRGEFVFNSEVVGNESATETLEIGSYVIDVYEYSNVEGNAKDTCIDVTLTAN